MASRKIFKKKTVIPKFLKTKFKEIDFQQEEPYWNFILRLPGPEKHPSNRAPERKQDIWHSNFFDKIYNKLHFYDFLKKCIGVPGWQKNGFESLSRDPEGFMTNIYFFYYKKSNFLFSILIDSPGFPGDPRGSWGPPGGPGTPKNLKKNNQKPKKYKNPKNIFL